MVLSEEHCFFLLLFYLFSFVGNKTGQMRMDQSSVLDSQRTGSMWRSCYPGR